MAFTKKLPALGATKSINRALGISKRGIRLSKRPGGQNVRSIGRIKARPIRAKINRPLLGPV